MISADSVKNRLSNISKTTGKTMNIHKKIKIIKASLIIVTILLNNVRIKEYIALKETIW